MYPNGDTPEEMRKSRDESNGIIFSLLMKKVKNVSDVINYKELKIKYYNSYSPVKTDKQREQNNKNKEDLENIITDLCHKEPLFCQIEVVHIKNERIVENGKYYLCEYEKIGYFDLNHTPLKEKINIIKKEEINEGEQDENQKLAEPVVNVNVYKAEPDNTGNLNYTKEEGNENNSRYLKYKVGAGLGGLGGAVFGTLGGLAYVGGITSWISLVGAIAAGAAATGAVIAAPVAIGIGIAGAIGAGIGYVISKLFD